MTIVPAYVYTWFPFSTLSYLPQHGDQLAAATIFFHLVYLLGHVFSKNNPYYEKLDRSKQASWCIHIVSQVFSSTALIASIPTFSEQELLADKLFGTTYYTRSLVAYACGYFLWDTVISIYYIDVTGPPFVFHGFACFSVFFLSYVCRFNQLPFAQHYGGVFLMFEWSTVFLNIHWFCDKTGMTGSTFQWVNGVILIIAFFVARLCYGTYKMLEFISTTG
jgi:hypothetical protein